MPYSKLSWRTYDLSLIFSNLANDFTLLCLVELAISLLIVFDSDVIYLRIIRYSNFVAIATLFALSIAVEGIDADLITNGDYGFNTDVSWTTVDNLFGAYYIIYWIISLSVVILSTIVLYSSIPKQHLQRVSKAPHLVSILPAV